MIASNRALKSKIPTGDTRRCQVVSAVNRLGQGEIRRDSAGTARPIVLLALAAFLGAGELSSSRASQNNSQPSSKELVETIIAGIVRNNSQITSIQATFEATVENAGLEKPIKHEMRTPSGSRAIVIMEPRTVFHVTYTLRAHDVRLEGQSSTWVRKQGVVTQFSPASKTAWIRPSNAIPEGFPPLDFREAAFLDTRPVLQILQEDKVLSAQLIAPNENKVIRVILQSATGNKSIYDFDASRNLLPTTCKGLKADGSHDQVVQLDYQEFAPGCWVLQTAKVTMYPSHGLGVKEVISSLTLTSLDTKPMIPEDVFTTHLPDGTMVLDNVSQKRHVVGALDEQPVVSSFSEYLWYGFALLAAAVIVLLGVKAKRYFSIGSLSGTKAIGGKL